MESIFFWFMVAVVGELLYVQYQLHQIIKGIKPKHQSGYTGRKKPERRP